MKKILSGFSYAFYIISHPIRGFYEMRFEKGGNLIVSLILALIFTLAIVISNLASGFIFSTVNVNEYNPLRQAVNIMVPLLLWCVVNWSITVLMDGEGRFKDIVMAAGYATVPYTITVILGTLLSLWLTADEAGFIAMVTGIGTAYSSLLFFTGTLTVHQFTVKKAVVSTIVTLAGMVFVLFLVVLFAQIMDQLFGYLAGIVTEIKLRM